MGPESWFDFRVTLGNIIESVVVLSVGIGFVWHLRFKISLLSLELTHLKEEITLLAKGMQQLGEILSKLAVQDNRIDRAEQDIRDLQRGEGKVLPLGRGPYEYGGT